MLREAERQHFNIFQPLDLLKSKRVYKIACHQKYKK